MMDGGSTSSRLVGSMKAEEKRGLCGASGVPPDRPVNVSKFESTILVVETPCAHLIGTVVGNATLP